MRTSVKRSSIHRLLNGAQHVRDEEKTSMPSHGQRLVANGREYLAAYYQQTYPYPCDDVSVIQGLWLLDADGQGRRKRGGRTGWARSYISTLFKANPVSSLWGGIKLEAAYSMSAVAAGGGSSQLRKPMTSLTLLVSTLPTSSRLLTRARPTLGSLHPGILQYAAACTERQIYTDCTSRLTPGEEKFNTSPSTLSITRCCAARCRIGKISIGKYTGTSPPPPFPS